jgi:hypothetical protein
MHRQASLTFSQRFEATSFTEQALNLPSYPPNPQVMPNLLARRMFKPPNTHYTVQPGYRDAPDISQSMAVVFCKVRVRVEGVASRGAAY